MAADLTKLEQDLEALQRDANRYRALRECTWHSHPMCVVMDPKKTVRFGAWCPSHTDLDDEVDKLICTLPYQPNRG